MNKENWKINNNAEKDNFNSSPVVSKTSAVDNDFQEKKPSDSELFRCSNCEKITNFRTRLSEQKEDRWCCSFDCAMEDYYRDWKCEKCGVRTPAFLKESPTRYRILFIKWAFWDQPCHFPQIVNNKFVNNKLTPKLLELCPSCAELSIKVSEENRKKFYSGLKAAAESFVASHSPDEYENFNYSLSLSDTITPESKPSAEIISKQKNDNLAENQKVQKDSLEKIEVYQTCQENQKLADKKSEEKKIINNFIASQNQPSTEAFLVDSKKVESSSLILVLPLAFIGVLGLIIYFFKKNNIKSALKMLKKSRKK